MAVVEAERGMRPKAGVPAVTKAVAIIRYLNDGPSTGAGLSEMAQALGVTKSHCHNILKTLVAEGWATFDGNRRRYNLAPRLLSDLSRLVVRQDGAVNHDEIVRLSMSAQVPCVLTRVEPDGSFVAIDKAEEAAELLISVPIGHRFPIDAPAQMRARLAFSSEAVRQEALHAWVPIAYAPTTIVDKDVLARELEKTRSRGYAISHEEFTAGVTSLAAPIYNRRGDVQMILQCPGLTADIRRREKAIAAELLETAGRINQAFR